MKAIEAATRAKYEQGDEYYGTWDDLDPVLQEYAISLTTIEIRAYLTALAEDDAAVEKVARAIVRNDRNYVMYHMPGDQPRKWKTPGGAIWDTNPLWDDTAERVRIKARAAIRAMGGE